MRRINKMGKSGFTLVEMVLVIAIVVILATVLLAGINNYIVNANNRAASVAVHGDVNDRVQSDIKALIHG